METFQRRRRLLPLENNLPPRKGLAYGISPFENRVSSPIDYLVFVMSNHALSFLSKSFCLCRTCLHRHPAEADIKSKSEALPRGMPVPVLSSLTINYALEKCDFSALSGFPRMGLVVR